MVLSSSGGFVGKTDGLHWTVKGRRASYRWLEGLMRFGQLARGLVYLIPGAFALHLALEPRRVAITQKRAIELVGDQPFGRVVLVVGLAGYALWGLYRAFFDPLGRGRSASGIFTRLGYLTSGLAYLGFLM